jgi:hypothetical protein
MSEITGFIKTFTITLWQNNIFNEETIYKNVFKNIRLKFECTAHPSSCTMGTSAEVKNGGPILPLPPYDMAWCLTD